MRRLVVVIFVIVVIAGGAFLFINHKTSVSEASNISMLEAWEAKHAQNDKIKDLIKSRLDSLKTDEDADPFGDKDRIKILFIGLDNRVGQTHGHCDAIQMIDINKKTESITITAVPRGTYSPLPGTGHKVTDYYVSNSCAIGGLEYGVGQIERILGYKTDYVVLVGFSQAIGIFRQLKLPTVETMQWLRHRQGYAIGEPQRARNHSNFLKQMMVKYSTGLDSTFSLPAKYVIYKLISTELSFNQIKSIADTVASFELSENPYKVSLQMRPAYAVQDFNYDPDNLDKNIAALINPIAPRLVDGSFQGETEEASQKQLLLKIEQGLEDPEFVAWAYDNFLWLQVEDDEARNYVHFQLLEKYIESVDDVDTRDQIITDFIIEMQDFEIAEWAEKGAQLLKRQLDEPEQQPIEIEGAEF